MLGRSRGAGTSRHWVQPAPRLPLNLQLQLLQNALKLLLHPQLLRSQQRSGTPRRWFQTRMTSRSEPKQILFSADRRRS